MRDGERDTPPGRPDEPSEDDVTCAHCGEEVDTSEWYPVTNDHDADGTLRIRSFCCEPCRDAFHDEGSESVVHD